MDRIRKKGKNEWYRYVANYQRNKSRFDSRLKRNSGSDAVSKREFRAQLQQTMGRRFSVRTIASFLFTSPRTGTQVAAGVLIANVPLFARQSRFYVCESSGDKASRLPPFTSVRRKTRKQGKRENELENVHKPRIFIFPRRRSTIVCFVYKVSMNGDDYFYDKLLPINRSKIGI